ncbi:hypothetical protein HPP92_007476 [Vanilla planifolia]|uniref:Reverse transcriptase zinc-binding domain-containing protein n=1 Tax=Vanilla planifolia TaxID=51239 RepID=A0A835V9G7_VANPL|nr:hypothetical protein HPP92_007476 [Vanilla planifolia]
MLAGCKPDVGTLKAQSTAGMFLWHIVDDYLPTTAWMAWRGMLENNCCHWGCVAESMQHVFWDCPHAQELWANCQAHMAVTTLGPPRGAGAGLTFLAISMYYIWERRNAMRHNNPVDKSCTLLRKIKIEVITAVGQCNLYLSMSSGNPFRSSDLLVTHNWVPPPPTGWIKVNCDAAVGENTAGLGLVIRDSMGRPLLVVGKRIFS